MRIVRLTAKQIRERGGGSVDLERLRKTSEAQIRRYIREDGGYELLPGQGHRVYNPPLPDVRAIRERLGLSQAEFAQRFNLNLRTIQQWEQGRAIPDRPARILLQVIAKDPGVVQKVVTRSMR